MPINETNEKRFESDIESALLSPAGGYVKGEDTYNPKLGLFVDTLIDFIQKTQPKEWARFTNTNKVNTVEKFRKVLQLLQQCLRHDGLAPCVAPRL